MHLREAGHSEIVLKMGTTDTCLNTVGRDQEGRERDRGRKTERKEGWSMGMREETRSTEKDKEEGVSTRMREKKVFHCN